MDLNEWAYSDWRDRGFSRAAADRAIEDLADRGRARLELGAGWLSLHPTDAGRELAAELREVAR
jgi:hypothetical protein